MKKSTNVVVSDWKCTKYWYLLTLLFIFTSLTSTNINAQCLMPHHDNAIGHGELHNEEELYEPNSSAESGGGENEICYIAINIHFIADDNGNGNFTLYDDGMGNTNYTGYDRAEELVNYANWMLANNVPMNLGTLTGVAPLPINYRLTLNGVYFHNNSAYQFDDDNVFQNDWSMHNLYGKDVGEVINVFYTKADNDLDINNAPKLKGIANGIGKDGFYGYQSWFGFNEPIAKLGNDWRYYVYQIYTTQPSNIPQSYNESARQLLHELGHIFDLLHSWSGNDGCNDTPNNSNAYCPSPLSSGSNNLMDYNCNKPAALTPCQLGLVATEINNHLGDYIASCGCEPTVAYFTAPSEYTVNLTPQPLWLRGKGSWKETEYKLEIFSVNQIGNTLPANPSDVYTSINVGTIGDINLKSIYSFAGNKIYLIRLTTINECSSDVMVRYMKTYTPNDEPIDPWSPTERISNPSNPSPLYHSQKTQIGISSIEPKSNENYLGLDISPNPTLGVIYLNYEEIGETSFSNLSILTIDGKVVYQNLSERIEDLPRTVSLENFPAGIYIVRLQNQFSLVIKKIILTK